MMTGFITSTPVFSILSSTISSLFALLTHLVITPDEPPTCAFVASPPLPSLPSKSTALTTAPSESMTMKSNEHDLITSWKVLTACSIVGSLMMTVLSGSIPNFTSQSMSAERSMSNMHAMASGSRFISSPIAV